MNLNEKPNAIEAKIIQTVEAVAEEGRAAQWFPMLLGLGGIVTCFFLWINLGTLARLVGTLWACAGILLWLVRRRFTVLPAEADSSSA